MSKRIINKGLEELENTISILQRMDCNFWACKGNPENNRIEHMITCGVCQATIHANRAKKQFLKIQKRMI